MYKKTTSTVIALIFSTALACAQSGAPVKQSGNITPNTVPWWITSGVIGGGVTAVDSPISSFGATGPICSNSARQASGAWNSLCFQANTNSAAIISLQNYGTATAQTLSFVLNGMLIPSAIDFLQAGAGAVIRTVQSKLRDTISVKDYGATGNGVTDDTAAINNAIAYARTVSGGFGAAVYLPGGSYKITSPINLLINVSLYGDCDLGSHILAVDTDGIIQTYLTQQGNPIIKCLYIEGVGQTAARKGIYVHGSLTDQNSRLYGFNAFDNIIWNFDSGIVLNNVQDYLISNNVIQNANIGIQILGGTYAGRIFSNKIVYQSGSPFSSGSTQAVSILPYTYTGTGVVGAPEGPIIRDNQIFGFQYGVNAQSAIYVVIDGNGIDGTLIPLNFQSVRSGFQVKNNYIELNGPLATVALQADGAGASPALGNVNIEGNTFVATETTSVIAGIRINGLGFGNPQTNVNIVRNYFTLLAGTDIILVQPTNINVENNTSDSTATTHSLSVDTRVAGIINVTKNTLSKDIVVTTASDLINGYIRKCDNVINVTTLDVCSSAGQLPATATNDNALVGRLGEYAESIVVSTSPVAIVTATAKTITSISLTPGDWDVDAVGSFAPANTTSVTGTAISISGTTDTVDSTPGRIVGLNQPATVTGGLANSFSIPPYRFSLSGNTTVYLVIIANFTVSTANGYGIIRARRVR